MLYARLRNGQLTFVVMTTWTVLLLLPVQALQAALPTAGEVVANDVYVRSGPSLNHYTIAKMSAGTRVHIVGEKDDWYAITPPASTFSLISGDYVDTVDSKRGVVNGKNVRVRAGSLLNSSKYTVQTQLSKGDEVSILGRNPDGFLRITPPADATLWVSKKFIEPITANETTSTPVTADAPEKPVDPANGSHSAGSDRLNAGEAQKTQKDDASSPFGYMEPTPQRRALEALETPLKTELEKPLLNRSFGSLMEKYKTIASQSEDQFSKKYAAGRLQQIEEMTSLAGTVRNLRKMNEKTDEKRRQFLVQRGSLHSVEPPAPQGLDVQGELRESALYPASLRPRRLRLVDITGTSTRTIGYVEIPTRSEIDVNAFIGRYVGVRVSSKRLQAGSVNSVPIYVASELVNLQPAASVDNN